MERRNYHHHNETTGFVVYNTRRRPYNYQAANGHMLMLIGLLIGSPFLFTLGFIEYATAPVYFMAAAGGTTALFSLATLGIGALIVYAATGLAYLYSGANECYKTDKGPWDLLKSRIVNEEGLSFKSVINSIGAVLWSPFLLLGGLSGMAVKAMVNKFSSEPSKKDSHKDTKNSVKETTSEEDSNSEEQVKKNSHKESSETTSSLEESSEDLAKAHGPQGFTEIKEEDKIDIIKIIAPLVEETTSPLLMANLLDTKQDTTANISASPVLEELKTTKEVPELQTTAVKKIPLSVLRSSLDSKTMTGHKVMGSLRLSTDTFFLTKDHLAKLSPLNPTLATNEEGSKIICS